MLQKLNEEVQECYRHADECRQRAEKAFIEKSRQEFLDMERRWLSLAHSYEFADSCRITSSPSAIEIESGLRNRYGLAFRS